MSRIGGSILLRDKVTGDALRYDLIPRSMSVESTTQLKERVMPFYELNELEKKHSTVNSKIESGAVPGEFMKFGIVTKPEGEGPPLHEHPNEEQFSVILSGQMHFVLGDEDRVVGPGTLIHIPRNTRHRSRPVNGPATFITVKSPCGNGELAQDYNLRPEAKEIEALYPGNKR
jgi:quercetin dioxygenase-like cupin family protein